MAVAAVQVIGLCRFSVPGIGAFQSLPDDIGARRAVLYAPDRMRHRCLWFEHVLLPGLRAQTDPEFRLILLLGEDFPDPWRRRILDLVDTVPQVIVMFSPPGGHREICANAMRPHLDRDARRIAQFRLDDDDAVAVDFVARLRADVIRAEPLLDRSPSMAFDYGKGLVLRDLGGRLSLEPCLTHCWSPALALVLPRRRGRFVLDYPHHVIWRRMPLLSQSDQIMFIRGAHGSNDSAIRVQERGFPLAVGDEARVLRDRFGISLADFSVALQELYEA